MYLIDSSNNTQPKPLTTKETHMSVHKKAEGLIEVRWRQGGRQKSVRVRSFDVAKKVQHKKLTTRDENRHLDVKKEINYKMSNLIDRYWTHYGSKKASADREKSIVEGIRSELGRKFVREVDGVAVQHWYESQLIPKGTNRRICLVRGDRAESGRMIATADCKSSTWSGP